MLQCKTKWKKKKLGSICNHITTGKLDAKAMTEGGKYRFYTCAENYYKIDTYAFEGQSLLISGNGANVGYVHYYDGKFNAYQRTYVLQNFDENIFYIKHYLKAYLKDRIAKEVNAGNIPFIKLDTLTDMNIQYPEIKDEQQKIADILSTCDEVIEKTEETIEKYKSIKAGLMQDLFTRGLDENGKLRPTYEQSSNLYKYSEQLDCYIPKAWDVDKLDNLFTYTVGGDVDKPCFSEYKTSLHKYPIFANAVDKEGLYGYSSNFVIDRPAITIAGRGVNIGTVFYRDAFFTPIVRLVVAFPNECLDILFASIALSRIKFESEATGIPQLTVPMVKKYKMAYPIKKDEQHNIYKYLNKIDLKLRKEEQYLNKYKQIKQGLMKRLLTPPADAEIVEE